MQIYLNAYSVQRDASTKIHVQVGAYEAAFLSAVFGKERVVRTADKVLVREVDPEMEAPRLMNKYGVEAVKECFPGDSVEAIKKAINTCKAPLAK